MSLPRTATASRAVDTPSSDDDLLAAERDARDAVPAIEQCYADTGQYPAEIPPTQQVTVTITCGAYPEEVRVTDGDTLGYAPEGNSGYTIVVTDPAGATATYNSDTGTIETRR